MSGSRCVGRARRSGRALANSRSASGRAGRSRRRDSFGSGGRGRVSGGIAAMVGTNARADSIPGEDAIKRNIYSA